MTTAPRDRAPDRPPAGLTVGGYEILSRLGEGGMGVVHLARRPGGPRVALKVLRPHIVGDDEARRRLAREVSSLERIRSRWVAEIVDADPWADIPYVATRYVPGLSLHDHVAEEGPITGEDLRFFARALALGVASVHRAGVLHRDVKPSNVLMEGRTPILIDFGLARVADDPKLTHTGWLLGTPGYLAPEILHGEDATTASDVHSWASTVAFAGTGNPPFGRGPSMAVMDRVRRGEHHLDGLPSDLRPLVAAALDPEPRRRPTLDELLVRLDPDHRPVAPIPVDPEPTPYDDVFTQPLALANAAALTGPTAVAPDPAWQTALLDQQPVREPRPLVLRRGLLMLGVALLVGAAVAAYPYPAVVLSLLLAWLLRSGSLTASATGDRQRMRGRARWYDAVVAPLSAPWHLVRALPGSVVLGLWSLGLAVAAGLVCYAVSATLASLLLVSGTALALSLGLGPGGSRVRSPLRRMLTPLARSPLPWALGLAVVLLAAGLLGASAMTSVSWWPLDGSPLDLVRRLSLP